MHHVEGAEAISVGSGGRAGWARSLDRDLTTGGRDQDAPGRSFWCLDAPWLDPETIDAGVVRFAGQVSAEELDRLYRGALCIVSPAYLEDYGLTAIEAMVYGKPLVVCSDGGNLVNFVEDGVNGFVVDRGARRHRLVAVQRLVGDQALPSASVGPRWSGPESSPGTTPCSSSTPRSNR